MGTPFMRQHELALYACRSSKTINKDYVSYISTILTSPRINAAKKHHPSEKPTALLDKLIGGLCVPDGLVLDPFMGSASTGVSALRLGRRFVGIEMDGDYFSVAKARIDAVQVELNGEACA
jgi:site-specific DNA-methyltransferase (adenine-specific)